MPRYQPLPDFGSLKVAVVGDLIADHYMFARPRRLSREAPVMVLSHEGEEVGAGGAANVARNLRTLGAEVHMVGVIGGQAGDRGEEVLALLTDQGVDVTGVRVAPDWRTPVKTRILAAERRRSLQQILRIDREASTLVSIEAQEQVATRLLEIGEDIDAVLIADYEYGTVGSPVGRAVSAMARAEKIVVLDPRTMHDNYRGLTALTPNMDEMARFTGLSPETFNEEGKLEHAAGAVMRRMACRYLLVTRGNRGMQLFGEGMGVDGIGIPASGLGEVTDVCGAGDTAAAVFALALTSGLDPVAAMVMANAASGVVVQEHGASACTAVELSEAMRTAPWPRETVSRDGYVVPTPETESSQSKPRRTPGSKNLQA
ncbi:MAG: rfaE bifunctional protein kinase chain/domain [Planctomycetota bacterium]|jgi:rfaE bifunctional protein kinase chain/domain